MLIRYSILDQKIILGNKDVFTYLCLLLPNLAIDHFAFTQSGVLKIELVPKQQFRYVCNCKFTG